MNKCKIKGANCVEQANEAVEMAVQSAKEQMDEGKLEMENVRFLENGNETCRQPHFSVQLPPQLYSNKTNITGGQYLIFHHLRNRCEQI